MTQDPELKRALRYDIIIFGATGFTGSIIVRKLIDLNAHQSFSWAIAGRSVEKMKILLETLSAQIGSDYTNIPIIEAKCSDQDSLNQMALKGRVVINCCGPYEFYGSQVVRACVENGASQIDICGEPEYIERVHLEYNEAAKEQGVFVISACGLDSVPADLGVLMFLDIFPGVVNSIESYMSYDNGAAGPVAHSTSWESAVYGFASQKHLGPLREELYTMSKPLKLEPKLKRRWPIHRSEVFDNKFCVPFILGSDRSVVTRTQMYLYNMQELRPVQYYQYFVCPSFGMMLTLGVMGFFLSIFSRFEFGRRLLVKFPKLFSLGIMSSKGPSEEALEKSSLTFKFKGEGWSVESIKKYEKLEEVNIPTNQSMLMELSCQSPAYGFTATSTVLAAMIIVKERYQLPTDGGVYTPASALGKSSFLQRLIECGLKIKVDGEENSHRSFD